MRENEKQREEALLGMVQVSRLTEEAFEIAVKLYGCVECASRDIAQLVTLIARARVGQICGEQTDGEPPIKRDGIKLACAIHRAGR